MRSTLSLTTGLLLVGLGLGATSAVAAPAVPPADVIAGNTIDQAARTTKRERMQRRMNTMRHGNPNAKFPERPGYQQNLGGTTAGPRY